MYLQQRVDGHGERVEVGRALLHRVEHLRERCSAARRLHAAQLVAERRRDAQVLPKVRKGRGVVINSK